MDDATRVEGGCMHGWGAQLFSTREDATFADKSRQIGHRGVGEYRIQNE